MKTRLFLYLTTICLLSSNIYAQVTIGSNEIPLSGALLQLTQGTTTSKGLGMPRVKLTDITNLYPMFTGSEPDYMAQKEAHIGLWLYNVSGEAIPKCAPIPDGLYVWDGDKWQGMSVTKIDPTTLDVGSTLYFDYPSGKDGRGAAIPTQSFNITWSPANPLAYTVGAVHSGGVPFTGTPLTASPIVGSPAVFSMTPDAMSESDVAFPNPWKSKESIFTFTATNECGAGESKTVTVNQTNYALQVHNAFVNSTVTNSTGGTFNVKGNTQWTTTINDPLGVLSGINPAIGTTAGGELKDGTTQDTNFNYVFNTLASKYGNADVTFKDVSTPKRYDDIVVSFEIKNCAATEPTLDQWKDMLGTAQDQIHATSKVAWHRDQNGNIFFSGDFGNAGRWMTTNLAATSFAPNAGRTGVDNTIVQNFGTSPSAGNNSYVSPRWGYPNGGTNAATAATFNANKRLGLLYNWAAATNSKGGASNGQAIPTSEGASNAAGHNNRQGICPNGWHIPSDWEWTELENAIIEKTSKYSSITDIGGTPLPQDNGSMAWRGILHGTAIKDICANGGGASNYILKGGFSAMLAGDAAFTSTSVYNINGYYWTSSSYSGTAAWYRQMEYNDARVDRSGNLRYYLHSVRCKQN